MYLKYIGKNGSMGLVNKRVYKVNIFSEDPYIWVQWEPRKACPYVTLKSLLENWIEV